MADFSEKSPTAGPEENNRAGEDTDSRTGEICASWSSLQQEFIVQPLGKSLDPSILGLQKTSATKDSVLVSKTF